MKHSQLHLDAISLHVPRFTVQAYIDWHWYPVYCISVYRLVFTEPFGGRPFPVSEVAEFRVQPYPWRDNYNYKNHSYFL